MPEESRTKKRRFHSLRMLLDRFSSQPCLRNRQMVLWPQVLGLLDEVAKLGLHCCRSTCAWCHSCMRGLHACGGFVQVLATAESTPGAVQGRSNSGETCSPVVTSMASLSGLLLRSRDRSAHFPAGAKRGAPPGEEGGGILLSPTCSKGQTQREE